MPGKLALFCAADVIMAAMLLLACAAVLWLELRGLLRRMEAGCSPAAIGGLAFFGASATYVGKMAALVCVCVFALAMLAQLAADLWQLVERASESTQLAVQREVFFSRWAPRVDVTPCSRHVEGEQPVVVRHSSDSPRFPSTCSSLPLFVWALQVAC